MSHTYEVFVDIKEFNGLTNQLARLFSTRYEVDAESKQNAKDAACHQAEDEYPKASEFDARITRLLH